MAHHQAAFQDDGEEVYPLAQPGRNIFGVNCRALSPAWGSKGALPFEKFFEYLSTFRCNLVQNLASLEFNFCSITRKCNVLDLDWSHVLSVPLPSGHAIWSTGGQ